MYKKQALPIGQARWLPRVHSRGDVKLPKRGTKLINEVIKGKNGIFFMQKLSCEKIKENFKVHISMVIKTNNLAQGMKQDDNFS